MEPFVSVVITGRNASSTIGECLQSVLSSDYPVERFEVIYVDAQSADDTMEEVEPFVKEHKNFRYLVESGLPGRGRNRGIEESKGEIIAFTDADCVVDESWIERIAFHLGSPNSDVAGVGGPSLTHPSDENFAKYVGRLWETEFGSAGARNPANYPGSRFVDHNPTCNSAYRRWIFNKAGLFDETLPSTEDEEFDTRIRRGGYRLLYSNDVMVYHHRKRTLKSFAKQMYLYGFWRAHSGKRQRVPLKFVHFGPFFLLTYLLLSPVLTLIFGFYAIVLLAIYFAFGLVSGIIISVENKDPVLAPVIPILGCFEHVAYGFGFILGLISN